MTGENSSDFYKAKDKIFIMIGSADYGISLKLAWNEKRAYEKIF